MRIELADFLRERRIFCFALVVPQTLPAALGCRTERKMNFIWYFFNRLSLNIRIHDCVLICSPF